MPKMNYYLKRIQDVMSEIHKWLRGRQVWVALTLGSGLGGYGKNFKGARQIGYTEVGLPTPGAAGHAGVLRWVPIGKYGVLIFDGRVHLYEGHPVEDVVLAVRAAVWLGTRVHILTCASGGISPSFKPGDLAIITDHINLTNRNPLVGPNFDSAGPRFPDMTAAYDPNLRQLTCEVGNDLGMNIATGVYAAMPGPSYETPAEINMLRTMGADMVGMSTVPEVIALRHLKAKVLGISCVSNLAAGVTDKPLNHDEVVAAGKAAAPCFRRLITEIITRL